MKRICELLHNGKIVVTIYGYDLVGGREVGNN